MVLKVTTTDPEGITQHIYRMDANGSKACYYYEELTDEEFSLLKEAGKFTVKHDNGEVVLYEIV